jgi:hypothetical protein
MVKHRKVLESGTSAGKTVTLSSTDRVEAYSAIAEHFMRAIFDLDPGEYLITDESDLLDFTPIFESDTSDIWRQIAVTYGVAPRDVNSGRLVKIFEAIQNRRRVQ